MIRPIDAYPGKVATPTSEYPDGKAQNITSPGDGTGTPWEAKLVNDIFGFQQFITAKAGITPNGTPDNATASQQFDALWKLLNARALTFNLTANANYTLTADQNLYGNLTITDTGVVLTAGRDIIVDTVGRLFLFTNSTAQTLTVKTLAGTGIAVAAGGSTALICDETDVLDFASFSGGGLSIASTAEAQTGTDNTKAITPLRLREGLNATGTAPIYACRAWVNFNGTGTVAIRASGNVSSITDNGTGLYTVNFITSMEDSDFSVSGIAGDTSAGRSILVTYGTPSPSNVSFRTDNGTAVIDKEFVRIAIFR